MGKNCAVKPEFIIYFLQSLSAEKFKSSTVLMYNFKYSKTTLENLGNYLSRTELIETKRGANGGFKLRKPLSEFKVSDLIPAIPENKPLVRYALSKSPDVTLEEYFKDFVI